jgi:hypothetical protein
LRANKAARRYLEGALDGGYWHELEGLCILAWAQGIPRAAFDQVLATLELETDVRGFLDERFLRLAPADLDWALLPARERELLDELVAVFDARPWASTRGRKEVRRETGRHADVRPLRRLARPDPARRRR